MNFLDKLKKWTDADDYEDEDEFEEYIPQNSVPERSAPMNMGNTTTYDQPSTTPYTRGNKVVNINATAQLQVVLVKPDKFENAAEIADHLKDRRTVVINLEQTNKEIARRLLDFLSGVAYAYQGKFQKIANSTFLITPYNVGIMGDIIDELESNGLYF
ncbi:MAG: cell division protein SepF [Ruminococcaceae bacterium]|nr:cell division protein SepF [Oscillospiraceae bacterium]MBQ4048821.1 cell division protein SepF [Clostridia bacterium]